MHPKRSAAASIALALTLVITNLTPVAAAPPDNDDVADAIQVGDLPFESSVELADATVEPGEVFGCANGDFADRSVWYAWTVPDYGTMRVVTGGAMGDTVAGIFGPYADAPDGLPAGEDLRWCVNGVGDEHNLVEAVSGGDVYLLQLSGVSTSDTVASLRIEFEASAYPAIDIAGTGGVSRIAGFARVSVGIACLYERPFYGRVSINQRLTRTTMAKGVSEFSGTCTEEMTWYDVYVGPQDHVPFGGGWAEVDFYAEVYGELHTDAAYFVTGVRLRIER